MCQLVELHGGGVDGVVFEVHETPVPLLLAWHDEHEAAEDVFGCPPGCEGWVVSNPTNPMPPEGVTVTRYRRRWQHAHRLYLPTEVPVPVPYDVVSEHVDIEARTR